MSASSPSSSMDASPSSDIVPFSSSVCQICDSAAHGNHFGAITCRACAAFFRRFGNKSAAKLVCREGFDNCEIRNRSKICKKCRLQRCLDVGMNSGKFQFDRDLISSTYGFKSQQAFKSLNIMSMEQFVGRPSFLISFEPDKQSPIKRIIDVQYLIDKATEILKNGPDFPPPNHLSSLEKLTHGLRISKQGFKKDLTLVSKIGENESIAMWEYEFLAAARWLTYFDELRDLPMSMKLEILKVTWLIWSRMENLAQNAHARRNKWLADGMIMVTDKHLVDFKSYDVDTTWFTNYSREQLESFFDCCPEQVLTEWMNPIMSLNPTDVELTFMLAHICFHFAGKTLQNGVLKVTDRFEEILSNNLHEYYTKNSYLPNYAARLASMMKINNFFLLDTLKRRERAELARIFQVSFVAFSDPDMFIDSGL